MYRKYKTKQKTHQMTKHEVFPQSIRGQGQTIAEHHEADLDALKARAHLIIAAINEMHTYIQM